MDFATHAPTLGPFVAMNATHKHVINNCGKTHGSQCMHVHLMIPKGRREWQWLQAILAVE
eukprot:COSAG05_NODE_5194_length_1239_cov_13.524978_1_plen_60_part_00